jgi:hypothetical protein
MSLRVERKRRSSHGRFHDIASRGRKPKSRQQQQRAVDSTRGAGDMAKLITGGPSDCGMLKYDHGVSQLSQIVHMERQPARKRALWLPCCPDLAAPDLQI